MDYLEIILIAIGLAMDATAVSLAAATSGFARSYQARFRLSFHFGLFQFAMPVMGWFLGRSVASYIRAYDHWIAFGLLAFVGLRMIQSGWHPEKERVQTDPSRGWNLITLSIATSIDALAIGLSLAMLDVNIWIPSVIIGVVTAGMSLLAIAVGTRVGPYLGARAEMAGGLILLIIGIRILAAHLLA